MKKDTIVKKCLSVISLVILVQNSQLQSMEATEVIRNPLSQNVNSINTGKTSAGKIAASRKVEPTSVTHDFDAQSSQSNPAKISTSTRSQNTAPSNKTAIALSDSLQPKTDVQETATSPAEVTKPKETEYISKALSRIFRPAKQVEIKSANELLKEMKDKDITSEKELTKQQFQFLKSFMADFRKSQGIVEDPKTLGRFYDAWRPDIQEINYRIKNLPEANRTTGKFSLQTIKNIEGSRSVLPSDKYTISKDVIQSLLNNILGSDTMSGKNKFSLKPELQEEFMNKLQNHPKIFDRSLPDHERLQAIADINDEIMNRLNSHGNDAHPAEFKTIIDEDGNYTNIITKQGDNGQEITVATTINNDGKPTNRAMKIQMPDKSIHVYRTQIEYSGTLQTPTIKMLKFNKDNPDGKPLTKEEKELNNLQYTLFHSVILGKLMLKTSLWAGTKQVAFTVATHPIPQAILYGSLVPLAITVKGGSILLGYDPYDPTIRTVFMVFADGVMGNRGIDGGILSNDPNYVFKHPALRKIFYNLNPFGKKEDIEINPDEEYFGFDTELFKGISWGIKAIFPDTFGSRLIPKNQLPTKTAAPKYSAGTAA